MPGRQTPPQPDRPGVPSDSAGSYCRSYHEGEKRLRIGSPGLYPKPGRGEQLGYASPIVLAADLGADRFAGPEAHQANSRYPDFLLLLRHQVHLDPMSDRLVKRQVIESGRVEIGAQLVVEYQ